MIFNPRPYPVDRLIPPSDQGERTYHFWLNAGPTSQVAKEVDRLALTKNEKPFVLSFYPSGSGSKPKPLAVLSDDAIQITVVKKAEKGNDTIIRLFEPTGRKRSTLLLLPAIGMKVKLDIGGFEIKTLRIKPRVRKFAEVDLLERPL